MAIKQMMEAAVRHHRAGRLNAAKDLCRRVLEQQPAHGEALNQLGVIAGQQGQIDESIDLIRRSIAASPGDAVFQANLGHALKARGDVQAAVEAYRAAVAIQPDFIPALVNLAECLKLRGDLEEAIAIGRRISVLDPRCAQGQLNLGLALRDAGRSAQAIIPFRACLKLNPHAPDAHRHLGAALASLGRFDEAIAEFHAATDERPNDAISHALLGNALVEKGLVDEAIASHRRAVELEPLEGGHLNNLGNALRTRGLAEESTAAFNRAAELSPHIPEIFLNLAQVCKGRGELDEAEKLCRHAISLGSDGAEENFLLAQIRLARGDFEQGWKLYEWRWKRRTWQRYRRLPHPKWEGEAIDGKTILLLAEQGFGDAIQFIRYAPMVAARGAKVLFYCPTELRRLLKNVSEVDRVIDDIEKTHFDLYCPLMSLPLPFSTCVESIPADIPYIRADDGLARGWRDRIEANDPRARVGLSWAGSIMNSQDNKRSLSFSQLAPIVAIDGFRFFSLQKGKPSQQIAQSPHGLNITDMTSDLTDFAETAALIANMDLVITVDTAVAHLAGAMGKPVWVLLPHDCDWRWLLHREDSPWYPTMRLFRQRTGEGWNEVIERTRAALEDTTLGRAGENGPSRSAKFDGQ